MFFVGIVFVNFLKTFCMTFLIGPYLLWHRYWAVMTGVNGFLLYYFLVLPGFLLLLTSKQEI